jgi:CspA family cold shock protein
LATDEGDRDLAARHEGTVKWFDDARGYGYIESAAFPSDVFVHYSDIVSEGFKTLETGATVEFTIEHSQKGLKAVRVTATGG